jgi:carboxylesterase
LKARSARGNGAVVTPSPQRPPAAPDAAPPGAALDGGGELDLGGGPDAALLLHGLTGSTFELHPLARRFQVQGWRVLAPVMAGHGGAPEALRGMPWQEWVASAGKHLDRLEGARRRFVVGCSMGALVACALAQERPRAVDGLVLLSPALHLAFPASAGVLLGRLGLLAGRVVPKGGSDVRDPEMRRRNVGLSGLPLGALAELSRLADHVERLLPGVRAPALVVAGGHDHTVTFGGIRRLVDRLGGAAELHVLPESFHLVGIDVERDRCAEEAVRFLARLATPGGS